MKLHDKFAAILGRQIVIIFQGLIDGILNIEIENENLDTAQRGFGE